MPPNEDKFVIIKIKCSHCGHLNEVPFSDFRSAMIGNHFFKLGCQKEDCGKRTFITYSMFAVPYNYGETPEKIFEKIVIPSDTQDIKIA